MADPRYLEAWKRGSSSSSARQMKNSAPVALPNGYGFTGTSFGNTLDKDASSNNKLNIRLDTPGGVTYSPSDLSSHNVIKRMFIPYKVGEHPSQAQSTEAPVTDDDASEYKGAGLLPVGKGGNGGHHAANAPEAYNFGPDLERDLADPKISDARKYALSINLEGLAGRPEGGKAWEEMNSEQKQTHGNEDARSTRSAQTTASTRTTATIATLAREKPDGSLPDWYVRPSALKDVAPFVVPPSFTGKAQDYQRPWAAMRWEGHRALERPSERENEAGIAAFADVNGQGRAPSIAETSAYRHEDDRASLASTVRQSGGPKPLSVADLFVIDPRISRPLRMVRRVDPRQVLLLCSGVYMEPSQVASLKAAQAAHDAGISLSDVQSSKKAQEMFLQLTKSAEARGGVGVLFCPSDDPLSQGEDERKRKELDPRFESNASKRLEAAPQFSRNTLRRAQLRAALAAIELANWEEEGFDKIVIGVEQAWIVRGITVDIWRWRHTGWKYTDVNEDGTQGGDPGESVHDRDLWEALDEAVRKYEAIDCNVRFWHVSKRDAALAHKLAEEGALKDVQQRPELVRWRKKISPTVADEVQRRSTIKANHQGPVLKDIR